MRLTIHIRQAKTVSNASDSCPDVQARSHPTGTAWFIGSFLQVLMRSKRSYTEHKLSRNVPFGCFGKRFGVNVH